MNFELHKNFSLRNKNTFSSDVFAKYYLNCETGREIYEILVKDDLFELPRFFLGNGSNVLFTKNYEGVIIQTSLKQIDIIKKDEKNVWIKASAAVEWDFFVNYCVENLFYGIENLTLIPGTVGASVVQNIGAYGCEVKNFVDEVEVIDLNNGEIFLLRGKECNFAYRDSLFKKSKNLIILSVVYKLYLTPNLNVSYSGLRNYLDEKGILDPTIFDLKDAVDSIRKSKLPDVTLFPNAGSFFKNPIISNELAVVLQQKYNDLPIFNYTETNKKVSAAWLIENAGLKGKGNKGAVVSSKHALILVKLSEGSGKDVLELSNFIIDAVRSKFDIILEPEVEVL